MKELFSGKYEYKGYHQCDSVCHLEVIETPSRLLVIATELDENQGTSITNCAEKLATEIVRRYNANPLSLTWIEHYIHVSYKGRMDDYSLVTFQWEGKTARTPHWTPTTIEKIELLKQSNEESQDG